MAKAERRFSLLLTALTAVLITTLVLGVVAGPAAIALAQVCQALLSMLSSAFDGWITAIAGWQQSVVVQVRLPRVLTAMLVGAALAISGVVLQALFRNPLASSNILGVSAGASLGAVLAIFFGLAAATVWALPLFAFIGATLSLALVYRIATQGGHTPTATLLLAGVAISAFNIAMSSFVQAIALENWEIGKSIVYWTMDGRTWDHVALIAPALAIGITVVSCYRRDLDTLLMGDIHAAALGVDVARVRLILLVTVALLDGAAVAVSGGIGFIGLVVPHIVRLLIGPHHRYLLPLSALTGAVVLALADLALRVLFVEKEVPVGVVTAALGAPFFVYLLLKQRQQFAL